MFRNILLQAILCLFVINITAQEYFKEDSLNAIYHSTENDSLKVKVLIELSSLFELNDFEKKMKYAKIAMDEALKSKDYQLKAHAYNNLAITFIDIGSYDKATEMLLKSKMLLEEQNDYRRLVGVVLNLGVVRFLLNDMEGALDEFNNALKLNNRLLEQGDSIHIGQLQIFYINIGGIYERKGNYKAAIEYDNRAIQAALKHNDVVSLASANNNLGEVYLELNDYKNALKHIRASLNIRQENNDLIGTARSYCNLVEYYFEVDRLDSAIFFNNRAIQIGLRLNALDILRDSYEQKSRLYEAAGNHKTALQALKDFNEVKDSLQNESVIEKTARLQMEYEFSKQEELYKNRHFEQLVKTYSSIGILLFLLVTFILLFFLWKSKAKRENIEKDSLRKDLELKNKELTTNVMFLLKKNELITSISDRLLRLKARMKEENRNAIQRIIFDLQDGAEPEVWEEFKLRFQDVHLDFYKKLQELAPDLTPSELKICAFLKLNMNSKEISSLIHQSIKSVEVKRSHIRKKLGLTNTDTNLIKYLSNI